ncbi:MAG: 2, Sm-like beta-barrel fold [Spirosoma sp.]|nr:2, Sm-like beta-barrel fold [Spirosoma sp.]
MKNQSISRADVLRTTWQIVRKSRLRFGVALKRAWAAIRAKAALATTDERGIWLSFRKVDGSVRNVLATRNMAYIPAELQPKNTGKPETHTIAYFDIWNEAWKCFRADSLLQIG